MRWVLQFAMRSVTKLMNIDSMISYIQGKIAEKSPAYIVIDKGGIGIHLLISLATFASLGDKGEQAHLETHLHVKEDSLTLFGFSTREERELFLHLLSVSGVGPKLAMGILSGAEIVELYHYIAEADENALVKIKGLGKKTAQRIILDLQSVAKKKTGDLELGNSAIRVADIGFKDEAVLALSALGYSATEADKAVSKAIVLNPDCENVETLIRIALNS